jgi:hypothetical protein
VWKLVFKFLSKVNGNGPLDALTVYYIPANRIGGVMVSVLASSAVDCGFEPRSGQTNDYQVGICCFSAKHAAFLRKSKRLVGLESGLCGKLLIQWASTIKIQLSVLF